MFSLNCLASGLQISRAMHLRLDSCCTSDYRIFQTCLFEYCCSSMIGPVCATGFRTGTSLRGFGIQTVVWNSFDFHLSIFSARSFLSLRTDSGFIYCLIIGNCCWSIYYCCWWCWWSLFEIHLAWWCWGTGESFGLSLSSGSVKLLAL